MNKSQKKAALFSLFNQFEYYKSLSEQTNFIAYEKLISSVLFHSQLGYESQAYNNFTRNFKSYIDHKFNIIFDDFVLAYEICPLYDLDKIVPCVISKEQSQVNSIKMTISLFKDENRFLTNLNKILWDLLKSNHCVEIYKGLILYLAPQSRLPKVAFSSDYVSLINKEN